MAQRGVGGGPFGTTIAVVGGCHLVAPQARVGAVLPDDPEGVPVEADRHAIIVGVSGAEAGVGGEFAGVVPRLAGPLLLVGPAVVVVVEVQCVAGPVAVGVPRGQRVVERVPAADDLVQVRPAVVVVVEVLGQQGRAAW